MNIKLQKVKLQSKVLMTFENKKVNSYPGQPIDTTTGTITMTGTGITMPFLKK